MTRKHVHRWVRSRTGTDTLYSYGWRALVCRKCEACGIEHAALKEAIDQLGLPPSLILLADVEWGLVENQTAVRLGLVP